MIPFPSELSGQCYKILVADSPKSRPLIVFFGAKDLSPGQFNFYQLGRDQDAHRIFFNNGGNRWYQNGIPGFGETVGEVVELIKKWKEALGATHLYTVGTSMGGYAAILYGSLLKADILAFSADSRLSRAASQSRRFLQASVETPYDDLRSVLAEHRPNLTLYAGERDAGDVYSAYELKRAAPIQAVSVVGAGHILPSYFSRRSKLAPLLKRFVNGQSAGQLVNRGAALSSKNYAKESFLAQVEMHRKAPDWDRVEEHASRALASYPTGEAALIQKGRALLKIGRSAEAVGILSQALVGQIEDTPTAIQLVVALRRIKSTAHAKAICLEILESQPGHEKTLEAMGLVYLAEKNFKLAEKYTLLALRCTPDHPTYIKNLEKIQEKLVAQKGGGEGADANLF